MEVGLQNVLKNFAKHRVSASLDPVHVIALLEQERVLNAAECELIRNQPSLEDRQIELYLRILPSKYEATIPILAQVMENISTAASDYLDEEYQKFKHWRRIMNDCCHRKEFLELDVTKVVEKLDDRHLLTNSEKSQLNHAVGRVQTSKLTMLLEIFANRSPKELKEMLQRLEFIDQNSGLASRFLKLEISEKLSHKFEEYKIFHAHDHHHWVRQAEEAGLNTTDTPDEAADAGAENANFWAQVIEDPEALELFQSHVDPNDIMPSLVSFRVFSYDDYQQVRSKTDVAERLMEFHNIIRQQFDSRAWKALLKSLRKNGYQDTVCEKLELVLQKYQ